jgi:hypothetical protein
MAVKQFEDLEVWQEARRLTQAIYRLTKADRFSKDFVGINVQLLAKVRLNS